MFILTKNKALILRLSGLHNYCVVTAKSIQNVRFMDKTPVFGEVSVTHLSSFLCYFVFLVFYKALILRLSG
jgi:hypothetical protein